MKECWFSGVWTYTFEADAYLAVGEKTSRCACQMSVGWASGWMSEGLGFEMYVVTSSFCNLLIFCTLLCSCAVEVSCRARGDKECGVIFGPMGKSPFPPFPPLTSQLCPYLHKAIYR